MTAIEEAPSGPSGLEAVRALADRGPGAVGVADLLEARIEEVAHGRVVFACETKAAFGNPMGTLHGGVAATLLDSAMGCAVMTALPAGSGYTTVDLGVTYLRPAPLDGSTVKADGHVVHVGNRLATAEGRLTDAQGRLVATGRTSCMVFGPSTAA